MSASAGSSGSLWTVAAPIAATGLALVLIPGMRRRKGVVVTAFVAAGAFALRSAIVAADRARCTGRRPRSLDQRMQPFADLLTMLLAPPLR